MLSNIFFELFDELRIVVCITNQFGHFEEVMEPADKEIATWNISIALDLKSMIGHRALLTKCRPPNESLSVSSKIHMVQTKYTTK